MWNYLELFYHEQGEEDTRLCHRKLPPGPGAAGPGLNLDDWTTDRNEPRLANQVTTDAQAANNAGLHGTPSFLIGKTGGSMKKLEYSSLTDPRRSTRRSKSSAEELTRAMSARTLRITHDRARGRSASRVASYLTYVHYAGIKPAVHGKGESCSQGADIGLLQARRACPSR